MLSVGLAVFDQRGVRLSHDELVLYRHGGDVAADHGRCPLSMVARGGDNVLASDGKRLFRRHQITTLLNHLNAFDDPLVADALKSVDLDLADDLDAALAGAFGHRHGHIGGVNVAVGRVIDRAFQIFGAD